MPFSFTCNAAFIVPLIPLCLLFGSFWAVVYRTTKNVCIQMSFGPDRTKLESCIWLANKIEVTSK